MSTRLGKLLRTEILRSAVEFAALEEEWEDLYHDSAQATPFQSWAWLYSWWESYGEDYELRLVTVRDGRGLLVGVAPLATSIGLASASCSFVGTGPTDYLDVLIRERWEDRVSEVLVQTLVEMDSGR